MHTALLARRASTNDGHSVVLLRVKRASTLLYLKDHGRATADAQAIVDSATATGLDLYRAAGIFAHCIRYADKDAREAESYAQRSVAALRKAAAKGFRDAARIQKNEDLEPLQTREDFRKLIAELEGTD